MCRCVYAWSGATWNFVALRGAAQRGAALRGAAQRGAAQRGLASVIATARCELDSSSRLAAP
jgi:hypothetical protein